MQNSDSRPSRPPLLQMKLYAFYPVCKRRAGKAAEPQCSKKLKSAPNSSAIRSDCPWQSIPLDVFLTLVQFLGFAESMHGFGSVCVYWRFAWKLFLGLSTDYFRQLSSAKHSCEDFIVMLDKAESQPHIHALKDFMENSGLRSVCALKHFFRTVRIYTEIDPEPSTIPTSLFKTFRIRHSNRFGELTLVSGISLGQICLQSRSSLRELSFENCVSIDAQVVHALAQCRSLQILNLSYSVVVDDSMLATIAKNCTSLQCLILQGLPRVSAKALESIGTTKVTKLDLSFCSNVLSSRSAFFPLLKLKLSHLMLNGLDVLDSDMETVAKLSGLKLLSVANCHCLTDKSLVYISKGLTNLEMLNLDSTAAELCQFSESIIFHMLKFYCSKVCLFNCSAHLSSMRIRALLKSRQFR